MSAARKEDKPFSGTEVGVLIESFRNDISLIAERLSSIEEKVDIIQNDVDVLKTDMQLVKDTLRIEIPKINSRLTALETKVG